MPRLLAAASLLVAACGSVSPASVDAGADDADAAVTADASPATPWIGEALTCGTPASAGGLASGTDLQRVELDPAAFPDALCNDGTRAVFYVRPAATPAARDRWVIQLQGGGGCNTADECAKRWCSVDTNFGETQMTATLAPTVGIVGDGVLRRGGAAGEPNPVGDWNHVFVRYCSSDEWSGTAGTVDLDGHDPLTGAAVRYRVAFDGATILDAVLATLRRDGAAPPPYTLGGGSVDLPDLDDAAAVLLAGASAGGAGVIANADRVRAALRAHNTACAGASCPLQMMALVDSAFAPSLEELDFSTSAPCTGAGVCDYRTYVETAAALDVTGARPDESCAAWHAIHDPTGAWRCTDRGHVVRDHVSTPMVVRMGLTDELLSSNLLDATFSVPGQGVMDLPMFAQLVHDQLAALPGSTPEEPFEVAPGVFGPPCSKHETLSSDAAVFDTTLAPAGTPYTVLDVLAAVFTGGSPTALVWSPGDPVDCP